MTLIEIIACPTASRLHPDLGCPVTLVLGNLRSTPRYKIMDMDIDWSQRVGPGADVLFQELNGESVLLNLASEKYFGLDEVGTRVWQLLANDVALETIVRLLLEEYDVTEAQLRHDVAKLVAELRHEHLIKVHEHAA